MTDIQQKSILNLSNNSFFGVPLSRHLENIDIAFLGIPFDLATTFRSGARFGPTAIRAASFQLSTLKSFPFGFNPFKKIKAIDYGDVIFSQNQFRLIPNIIENFAKTILEAGVHLISFGGDHFITYPLLKAHADKHGPLALIHFDAHPDTWPKAQSDGNIEIDHGTMFNHAVKEGLVIPKKSVQIGIRTWVEDKLGFNILDAPWVHQHGPQAVVEEIYRIVGDHKAYITFDVDGLDPAYAPGTGTPIAGGLSTAQAFSILRALGDINAVGLDVVEVAPAYDHAEITAIAAATIAYDYVCLYAKNLMAIQTNR